jgi:hypothetical protein
VSAKNGLKSAAEFEPFTGQMDGCLLRSEVGRRRRKAGSLEKVDEFMHISRRLHRIALQSAIGGMALSVIGTALVSGGLWSPVAGALSQEIIDALAIFIALQAAIRPRGTLRFRTHDGRGPVASDGNFRRVSVQACSPTSVAVGLANQN